MHFPLSVSQIGVLSPQSSLVLQSLGGVVVVVGVVEVVDAVKIIIG